MTGKGKGPVGVRCEEREALSSSSRVSRLAMPSSRARTWRLVPKARGGIIGTPAAKVSTGRAQRGAVFWRYQGQLCGERT